MTIAKLEKPDQWDPAAAGLFLRRKTRNKYNPTRTLRGPTDLVAPSEWDEAIAIARSVTGHPSPPAKFVSALWQQRNRLRFAIHYAGIQPDGAADLQRIVRALGWATKWILRALNGGKTSKKSTAEQAEQLRWSINALRPLFREGGAVSSESISPSPSKIFNYLYEATPIDSIPAFLRCDDDQMSECLNLIERFARDGKLNNLRKKAFPNKSNFVASLEILQRLVRARLSAKLINKRMKPISAENAATRKYRSNRELHRLLQSERWSAKLLCAVTIRVGEHVWPEFSTTKEEACEELWKGSDGTPHTGVDEVHEEWNQKWLRAARETDKDIPPVLASSFFDFYGPNWFRPFDRPLEPCKLNLLKAARMLSDDSRVVRLPEEEYQKAVEDLAETLERIPEDSRLDRQLVTLKDADNFIARLPKVKREAAAWRDAKEALNLAADDGSLTSLARARLHRAFQGEPNAKHPLYDDFPRTESSRHPDWVVAIRIQILEYLRAGHSCSVDEIASEFNLKATLAETLLKELEEEKLWSPSRTAVPQNS